ncbi:MAG TPA: Rieske 2Fe-2S domain-containing protein [Nitrososphaeraceae archaeon]|nr:Rieske 2Fe-2S domain-containing protein [Nitrososphaeraceae archaeon]
MGVKRIDNYKDEDNNNKSSTFRYLCTIEELQADKSRQFLVSNDKGAKKIQIAVFNVDGKYYCISNKCQHQGGPLSKGILDEKKKVVTCPWHGWKYSIIDGKAPHEGGDSVDSYKIKIIEDKLYVNSIPTNIGKRVTQPHKEYSELQNSVREYLTHTDKDSRLQFSRDVKKTPRILGISTTNSNDKIAPRKSTSEDALNYALDYAKHEFGAETKVIKLRDLHFKHCEGYYSKNASACIFPCSISEMDKDDQMIEVYQKVILWADVVIIATPIRWGNASSLYYQMVQRMNCVQNQSITNERYLIRDKVAAFIITGGQDNVQHVAGELLTFWSQLGFVFGKFPFVGWTRGWYAEDTENNFDKMKDNEHMRQDIIKTISAAVEMSKLVKENRYDERVLKQVHS